MFWAARVLAAPFILVGVVGVLAAESVLSLMDAPKSKLGGSRPASSGVDACREWVETHVGIGPAYEMEKAVLASLGEAADI